MINVWFANAKSSELRILFGAICGALSPRFTGSALELILRSESGPQVEDAVWTADSLTKSN
jgi:hypothetical protein